MTLKVQRRSASIGFVKKALYQEDKGKLAKMKEQLTIKRDMWICEQKVMLWRLGTVVITNSQLHSSKPEI